MKKVYEIIFELPNGCWEKCSYDHKNNLISVKKYKGKYEDSEEK